MKKFLMFFLVAFIFPVILFADGWQKSEEFDEFGDPTGKSEIVLLNQSGTYNSVSGGVKNGKLIWECHSIPNGDSYIILKENGRDVNLSTAKYKSDTFTIKIKSDFGTVKDIKGQISLNGSSYNAIMLEDSYVFQSLIASNKSPKIVVSCDNGEGSYSLGTVSSESFKELVFEKSVYDHANKLIQEQKIEEARTLLIKFEKSNPNGYKYLNCNYLYGKTINGPAGGYIFYDKGYCSDGWRYLEAAPKDLQGKYMLWGDDGRYGTKTAVGTGKNNTEKIVQNASKSITNNAAVACANYSVNGYDDWFLPSKDELNQMYENLKEKRFGGFADKSYWSSSEGNDGNAWMQYFDCGIQDKYRRNDYYFYVRPVRAFSGIYNDELYNQGLQLINSGKYDEALDVFEKLEKNDIESFLYYKASIQVERCKMEIPRVDYSEAVSLMNQKKYTEAIEKFTKCINYSDSDELIEKCKVEILRIDYNEAVSLMNQKKYTEAIEKFTKCINYSDSVKQIVKCKMLGNILSIGDVGPAGGYIFYDKGYYSDGWRYLEAAPRDLQKSFKWGNDGKYETQTGIGAGKSNTKKIVDVVGGDINIAAVACVNFSVNGYDDWFLPSKDELNLMYENLKEKGLGGFDNTDEYWSSSESINSYAWHQNFGSGYQGDFYGWRSHNLYVRPVRAF